MFKRILVPLDGSELAEQALPVVAQIARASGGSILLFGVVTTPVEYSLYLASAGGYGWGIEETELKKMSTYLQSTAKKAILAGVPVETQATSSVVVTAILAAERTYRADLVVMSSHGYTGVKRRVLGSVAQKIARYSSVPVLVLRADGTSAMADQPQRVLVPLDGSPLAEVALEPAMQLAMALSGTVPGELHLLRVITASPTGGKFGGGTSIAFERAVLAEEQQAAQTYLEALKQHLRASLQFPVQITTSIVSDNDIAAAIIYAGEPDGATDSKASTTIVMATHGRSGLRHWALGSITERVLGATHLPLLIVRPKAQQEQREPIEAGVKEVDVPAQ